MSPRSDGRLVRLLARAEDFSNKTIDLGLEATFRLLADLDNPQAGLSFIHIAGTNGKGSVLAFLTSLLRRAGASVGSYTSPHLVRFNERICINGKEIADALLADHLEAVLTANGNQPATFFELTTACALRHFSHVRPDWCLLETGLGGRLDATNVVTPRLSIITPIGSDHGDFLGHDIRAIAGEKAGIIKAGIPVAAHADPPEAAGIVRRIARERDAPLIEQGRDYDFQVHQDGSWRYEDRHRSLILPPPGLAGHHQYGNAALALAAFFHLPDGPSLPSGRIGPALAKTVWPARLERFPGPPEIWPRRTGGC